MSLRNHFFTYRHLLLFCFLTHYFISTDTESFLEDASVFVPLRTFHVDFWIKKEIRFEKHYFTPFFFEHFPKSNSFFENVVSLYLYFWNGSKFDGSFYFAVFFFHLVELSLKISKDNFKRIRLIGPGFDIFAGYKLSFLRIFFQQLL